jgi:hypothetical protein
VTTRFARDNDPGAAAIGYFIVEDEVLTMTDETGKLLKGVEPVKLGDPAMARSITASLTAGAQRGRLQQAAAISENRVGLGRVLINADVRFRG